MSMIIMLILMILLYYIGYKAIIKIIRELKK